MWKLLDHLGIVIAIGCWGSGSSDDITETEYHVPEVHGTSQDRPAHHFWKSNAIGAIVSTLNALYSGISICVPLGRSIPYTLYTRDYLTTRVEGLAMRARVQLLEYLGYEGICGNLR